MTALFEALCRASVFGLAALGIALLAQWILNRRVPAAWRVWIWRVALGQSALALLPFAPLQLEILPPEPRKIAAPKSVEPKFVAPKPVAPPEKIDSSEFSLPPNPNDFSDFPRENSKTNEIPVGNPAPIAVSQAPKPSIFRNWRAFLLMIYALGIAVQVALLLRGAFKLRRVLNACAPLENAILNARAQEIAAQLGSKNAPQIWQSESGAPFLTGLWRAKIVLPRALVEGENAPLNAVLAHELAHQKRRDLAWNAIFWLAQTIFWFHPLSFVARRFHGLETESACDEAALQLTRIAPKSYGALLLTSMNNFHSPLAAGTCDSFFALKTRLTRLQNAPQTPRRALKIAFFAALLLSFGALVPFKLVARAQDSTSPTATPTPLPTATPQPAKTMGLQGVIVSKETLKPLVGVPVSAVVQGVVVSRQSGKPLAGVLIFLHAPYLIQEQIDATHFKLHPPETRTDARGYFRFNSTSGAHVLDIDGHALSIDGRDNHNKKSVVFVAQQAYAFNLKTGEKRDFKTELDEKSAKTANQANAQIVRGTVRDFDGNPVAGAKIFLTRWNFKAVKTANQTTVSDARGQFSSVLAPQKSEFWTVFVDAGARGFREQRLDKNNGQMSAKIQLAPISSAQLRFVDARNQPISGLKVRLYRIGPSANSWLRLQSSVWDRLEGATNERGEIEFPCLPA